MWSGNKKTGNIQKRWLHGKNGPKNTNELPRANANIYNSDATEQIFIEFRA